MFKLVIQDDEGKTTVVPLIRDEITVGRKEGNTIRLTERNVSRRHARIVRNNGAVLLEDLDSYNGILVNGARIQGRVQLGESDRIQIGDYLIELQSENPKAVDPYGEQRTQPIERVDPMANTPVPDMTPPPDSNLGIPAMATNRLAVGPSATVFGMQAPGLQQPMPGLGLADTDPGLAAVATQAGHARMVVLSSNFAGREFMLDKPASVIGRTEDNDICVNHRSISRHHAKIVREQGRYAIVDLQSSNGVRVNGEEYGKVELRRGDVVDLGHVRMRFVEPGEDFLFGRDAQIVDISQPEGRSKVGLWAALALAVVGAGVAAVVLTRGGGDEGVTTAAADRAAEPAGPGRKAAVPPETNPDKPPAEPVGVKPAVGPADAAPVVAPPNPETPPGGANPPPAGGGDVRNLINESRGAIENERWADAQELAAQALKIDPENADAKELDAQARRELKNQMQYGRFMDAVRKKQYDGIAAQFEKLDRESVYRVKAQSEHDRMRDEYVEQMSNRAEKLVDAGKCRELPALERTARRAWPEAGQAVAALAAQCKRVAVVPGDEPPPDRPPPPIKEPTPPVPPPGGGVSCQQMIKDAKIAAKGSQYGKALKLCEDALDLCKGDQEATMVCAIAACSLKNESKAKRFIKGLRDSDRRGMAVQICLRSQINVE